MPVIMEREVGDGLVQTVNGRDLHASLGVGDHFSMWIRSRIVSYKFSEGVDFASYSEKTEKGAPRIEYALTIDMAKELAMVERNEAGRRVRLYFIAAEKALRQSTSVTPRITPL